MIEVLVLTFGLKYFWKFLFSFVFVIAVEYIPRLDSELILLFQYLKFLIIVEKGWTVSSFVQM